MIAAEAPAITSTSSPTERWMEERRVWYLSFIFTYLSWARTYTYTSKFNYRRSQKLWALICAVNMDSIIMEKGEKTLSPWCKFTAPIYAGATVGVQSHLSISTNFVGSADASSRWKAESHEWPAELVACWGSHSTQGHGCQSPGLQMQHSIREERARTPGPRKKEKKQHCSCLLKFSWAFSQAHGAQGKFSETLGDREGAFALDQDPSLTNKQKEVKHWLQLKPAISHNLKRNSFCEFRIWFGQNLKKHASASEKRCLFCSGERMVA